MGKNDEKVGKDRIVVGLKYQGKTLRLSPIGIGKTWTLNLCSTYSLSSIEY